VIKLVIFDLDGVLVNACEWHRVALNEALRDVCNYEISLEDHYSTFNGIPTKKKLDILLECGIIREEDIEKVYNKKQNKTLEVIEKSCKVREEKVEMLKFLKNKGIILACYTNSIRETGALMLKNTGIYDFFDLFISNQDVPQPKPSPSGYVQAMDHFNIEKENALIIEDSPKGFEAAYRSGAKVFRVINQDQVDIKLFKEFVK
jgi:beta-phosphoglucomutase